MSDAGAPPPAERTGGGLSARRRFAWLRRFAKLWGFALFLLLVVVVFRHVILPFVFAVLVAYIMTPVVRRLTAVEVAGRRLSRGAAVIGVYVIVLTGLGLFFTYVVPRLASDFARLFREVPALYTRIDEEYVPRLGAWIEGALRAEQETAATPAAQDEPRATSPRGALPPGTQVVVTPLADGRYAVSLEGLRLDVEAHGRRVVISPGGTEDGRRHPRFQQDIKRWIAELVRTSQTEVAGFLRLGQLFVLGVARGVATFILVLMIAAFILIDLERVNAFVRSLVPESYRADYDVIIAGVDRGLGGVIRGQLLICLINGLFTYAGLLLFDVRYALVLGLLAAVMSLIPIFGSVLSSIPIVAVAMVSSPGALDVAKGAAVLGWIVVIHLVEANLLNPKIIGTSAKIHPVVVIFSLLAGERTYGLVGALLAVPVASMIQTLFLYFRRRAWARPG